MIGIGFSTSIRRSIGVRDVSVYGAKGDGTTDDTEAIQAALTAAQSGEVIYFSPNKSYLISDTLTLFTKTNVSIVGIGATLVSDDVDFTQILHGHPMLYVDTCTNCVVSGLRFDMDGITGTNNASAIMVEDSSDITIEYCEAWGANSNGTFLEGDCDRNVWKDCIARDSRNTTRGFWLGNVNTNEFTRQAMVENCKAFDLAFSGFVIFSDGGRVSGCYSYNNAGSGFVVPGTSSAIVKDLVFTCNHAEGNTFYGFQEDPTGSGGIKNISFVGNVSIGNTQGGFLLNESENTMITGNSIKNNIGRGIEIEGGTTGSVIVGNLIVDDQATATQDDGIQMNTGDGETHTNILISDNHIEGNQTHGIELQTTVAGATFNGVYIKNNVIKNNGSYGLFSANNGTVSNLMISGNEFSGNTTRDVRLTGISSISGVVFKDNRWDKNKSSFDQAKDGYHSAAPTSGTWAVGDVVYHSAPAAAGNIGWVCVTAGSPGTWKSFGTIAS